MRASISAKRYWATLFFVLTIFCVIVYQLLQLMIFHRPTLLGQANKQHLLRMEIPPFRGPILDRNGQELATNLKVPSVYAVPRIATKREKDLLAEKAAKILNLNIDKLRKKLDREKSFVWIKRRVSVDEAEKIGKLGSPVFGIVQEPKRFYPQGDLLAQVIGFVDVDNRGLEGIELQFNKELQGRSGFRVTKRDALGREIKSQEVNAVPSLDGNKIYLTIDQYIQYLTERAIDRAFNEWHAKGAFAVVMNPHTGEILALANRPTFDLNQFEKSQQESRRNRVVTDMYEPGSVFKIVAASAALNEDKVTLETNFFCENGKYNYGPKVLHDVHSYGNLSFRDVIVKSSNIGAVKIAALLDPEVFYRYVRGFGFAERTGIDLPGEAPGFVRPPSQWSKTSAYNIPIGHEVMVTALQIVRAMAVIANGGKLVKPYVIWKVEDNAGVVLRETLPVIKDGVIKPEVAETMRQILTGVVDEGTGKKAKIDGVAVAGKTGTAQKVLPGGKGYSHSTFMSSFVGFAPAEDPQFVMVVVLDEPRPSYYGGTVAAPPVKEVFESGLIYLKHIPENAKPLETKTPSPAEDAPKKTPSPAQVKARSAAP